MPELAAVVAHLAAPDRGSAVLATLVAVAGSSYRRPGARLLVTAAGERLGSISGGCLEEDVLARAQRVATTGRPELVTYDTSAENDLVWGVGLGCHGVVQVLLEPIPSPAPAWVATVTANLAARRPTELAVVWQHPTSEPPFALGTYLAAALPPGSAPVNAAIFRESLRPPPSLLIFGAGDDAQPLAALAGQLGWSVTVADPRAAFATVARFPTADPLVVAPAADLVARLAPEPAALAVVMTHHYVHDVPLLHDLLPLNLSYLGLLGPKKRADRILADLARDGLNLNSDQLARLHAPVGLDLGAERPAEVALAILAEMQAALTRRDARPLRERTRPIHD
ncbi:MAG: XdhC family protein [Verrucomicrobia bacterium]|nr:XdhC family protein [Verrucomicrobiota bacterium]